MINAKWTLVKGYIDSIFILSNEKLSLDCLTSIMNYGHCWARKYVRILLLWSTFFPLWLPIQKIDGKSWYCQASQRHHHHHEHCDQILRNFETLGQLFEGLFCLGQNFKPNLVKTLAIGQSYIVVNGPNLKQNLAIWSHWSRAATVPPPPQKQPPPSIKSVTYIPPSRRSWRGRRRRCRWGCRATRPPRPWRSGWSDHRPIVKQI